MKYNYILVCAIVAWASAQIIKTVINTLMKKKFTPERLIGSGGMPSSHSSFVIAGLTAVGRSPELGVNSPSFAIMFIISMVVIYDAMNVRYAAGLHAKELNRLNSMISQLPEMLKLIGGNAEDKKRFKEYLGHTPYEVLAGVALGILVAFIMPLNN